MTVHTPSIMFSMCLVLERKMVGRLLWVRFTLLKITTSADYFFFFDKESGHHKTYVACIFSRYVRLLVGV